MTKVKVISFDLHETIATPEFVLAVWYEGIPAIYAQRHKLSLDAAKEKVDAEYKTVSEDTREYFDLKYWAKRLDLGGYQSSVDYCKHKVAYYPETMEVLDRLSRKYPLIISTSMPREFMPPIMAGILRFFTRDFSSFSDCNQFKTPEFYRIVLKEMGLKPEEMLHVGDNWKKDYIMPCEVGIKALHLERKAKPGFCTITDLRQLEERIERSNLF